MTEKERKSSDWWWLKTQYTNGDKYAWYINHGGLPSGNIVCKKGGIRPVIIVNLKKDKSFKILSVY